MSETVRVRQTWQVQEEKAVAPGTFGGDDVRIDTQEAQGYGEGRPAGANQRAALE